MAPLGGEGSWLGVRKLLCTKTGKALADFDGITLRVLSTCATGVERECEVA